MPVSLIAAVARGGVIGRGGRLPWRLPADLAHFRRLTFGHAVLMGRRTWDSLGRPLPGRRNLVLTRNRSWRAAGCEVVHTVEEALGRCGALGPGSRELFVIGGASLYEQMLPRADRLYLTHVDAEVSGDSFFPPIDPRLWRSVSEVSGTVDAENPLPHRFAVYERIP